MLKTAQKIFIAKLLNRFVLSGRKLLGLGAEVVVKRSGMRWELDLNEGIDFSIWLLGGFEPRTLRQYEILVKPGDTVLDVGANVGAHTLPFARLVGPCGQVIAFEPTKWAFGKLRRNLELNPEFSGRVEAIQALLVAECCDGLPEQIYSSWPLNQHEGLHEQHKGKLMATTGASVVKLDDAVASASLESIALIKIDVDGHEFTVIKGAMETLKRYRPIIVMELAPYVYTHGSGEFEALLDLMDNLGYVPFHEFTGKALPLDPNLMIAQHIPEGGSINVIFKPV